MPIAKRFALVALLSAAPATATTQGATADLIARGITAYEAFQVEAARPLFQQVISPSYVNPVTPDQKVTALKYLGASYAVLGIPDSALTFFQAALEFDPFTDLDPAKFSSSEQGPFNNAKTKVFKIGVRSVDAQVVDPRADSTAYRFRLVSTHRVRMTVELVRQPDTTLKESLFDGDIDGPREIRWSGFLNSVQRIADSSTYQLRVSATSTLIPTAPRATETQFLRVEHAYEPLEDTLPTLPDSMLLPAQIPGLAPWLDLVKGVAMGGVAFGIQAITGNSDLNWRLHALVASGVGVVSGGASFIYRRANRAIPENVTENARRQQQRTTFNDGVRARNAQRLALTKLIITPLTGAGR